VYGDQKPVPRHCDPDRFGMSVPGGGWQPFRAFIETVNCACGHRQCLAIGIAPGEGEEERLEEALAMAQDIAEGPCLSCRPSRSRELCRPATPCGEERPASPSPPSGGSGLHKELAEPVKPIKQAYDRAQQRVNGRLVPKKGRQQRART
jgi:hypothetical protein